MSLCISIVIAVLICVACMGRPAVIWGACGIRFPVAALRFVVHQFVYNFFHYFMIILHTRLVSHMLTYVLLFMLCCVAFLLKHAYCQVDGTDHFKSLKAIW